MQNIYIDVLFFLNFTVDYLILLSTAKLCDLQFKRRRLIYASLTGALYSVIVFFPNISFASTLPLQMFIGVLMIFISYGTRNRDSIIRIFLAFFMVSASFAGIVICAYFLFGGMQIRNGVYYMDINIGIIIAAGVICYGMCSIFFGKYFKHNIEHTIDTFDIYVNDRQIKISSLLDTGNILKDSSSGLPVIVIEKSNASSLFPPSLLHIFFDFNKYTAPELLEKISFCEFSTYFRLVPYSALGTEHSLLLAFKPDKILKNGEEFQAIIAISPHRITNGKYSALHGNI